MITEKNEQVANFHRQLSRIVCGLEKLVINYKSPFNGEIYHTDKELSERLKISRRTLQEWRNSGIIDYVRLGGKTLYPESAVQTLLAKNYRKATA